MRHAVDEVGMGDERRREAHDGPVESHDEDLGVRRKGAGDVQVEGGKGGQPEPVGVFRRVRSGPCDGDVGAAGDKVSFAGVLWAGNELSNC